MKLKTFVLACACAGALVSIRGQVPPAPAGITNKTVKSGIPRTHDSGIATADGSGEVTPAEPRSPSSAVPENNGISSLPQTGAKSLVACSSDGEFFAVASPDGRLKYCRTRDGVVLHGFYQCHPKALVFSADGRLLASVGGPNGGPSTIKVFRVSDNVLLCKMQSEAGNNPLLSFSPDGLLLASSDGEKSIQLWQLPEGSLKRSATVPRNVSALAWPKQLQALVAIFADGTASLFCF